MTEEERNLANRLADEHVTPLDRALAHKAFVAGYAAACESKRAEIEELRIENEKHRWRLAGAQVDSTLEAERALSAKLYATLSAIREYLIAIRSLGTEEPVDVEVLFETLNRAITEYVAARV